MPTIHNYTLSHRFELSHALGFPVLPEARRPGCMDDAFP